MKFQYVPKQLIQSREEVALRHAEQKISVGLKKDDDLKKLIEKVASLDRNQVKKTAFALTEQEVIKITKYLPYNYYSVKLKNLFQVFQYRSTSKLCEILYNEWQESYENAECNYNLKILVKYNKRFSEMLELHHFKSEDFIEILESSKVAYQLGKKLQNDTMQTNRSLQKRLEYLAIRSDSKLFQECEFMFYCYCKKADYIADNKELVGIVERYNWEQLRYFVYNFLMKLSLNELQEFPTIVAYMIKEGVEPGRKNFKSIFERFPDTLIEKYVNWLNSYKIEQYFGNDERSRFWKQYKFEQILLCRYSDAVIMEFKKYYAVEFLGYNMGPIYIYEKQIFQNSVRKWFSRLNNSELRSKLYNSPDLYFYRKAHQGYWQEEVQRVLLKDGIVEYLNH